MSLEENKALVRRLWEEGFNKRNLAIVDELCATNYVLHIAGFGDIRGPEAVKQSWAEAFTGFPDYHATIEDMVSEADKVVARFTETGTHQGEYLGIAPTGKRFIISSTLIDLIVGGKFVEAWLVMDILGMLQQLGIIPSQ